MEQRSHHAKFVAVRVAVALLALDRLVFAGGDLLRQFWSLGDPPLRLVQWLDLAGLAVLSIATVVATFLGRRVAIRLALGTALFELLALGRVWLPDHPFAAWALVAWLAAAVLLVHTLPPNARPARSARADVRIGLGITLILFVLLEAVAGILIINVYTHIQHIPDPPTALPPDYVAGLPTVATIGSSPANCERVNRRPFSAILAERHRGRFNYRFSDRGGLHSDRLVTIVDQLLQAEPRPDALILYIGHQDLNVRRGSAFLQSTGLDENAPTASAAVRRLLVESSLVRLSVYLAWTHRYDFEDRLDRATVEATFRNYAKNIDHIVEAAERRGVHVFAATVAADRRGIAQESIAYMAMENTHVRGLPERFPNVTLVDFDPLLAARYPEGPTPTCEPFEADPHSNRCGDPYHLGPRGHEILADLLASEIERWERELPADHVTGSPR